MKAANWIIPALSTLCFTAVALAANPSSAANLAARVRLQQDRLPQIEQMANQEREQVEQWYKRQRAAAPQEDAREAAVALSQAQRTLWVEFAKMHQYELYAPGYFGASYYAFPFGPDAALLRYAMDKEYCVSEMTHLLLSEGFRQKLTQIVNEHWEVPLLQREASQLLVLMDSLDATLKMHLQQLDANRQARLDAVSQRERDLQEQVRTISDYLKEAEQRKPQLGVVEAVAYSPQSGYFCMIEGIDEVLRPGDRVRGGRVVRIDPEKVEFARDGVVWTQELGAPAQPHWDLQLAAGGSK
jgi:hypothetical protein